MQSVYPTGTTIYKPGQCMSGYTILSGFPGAVLIDMNGNEVRKWDIQASVPNKILPGGHLLTAMRGKGRNVNTMVQMDWDGNVVWKFDQYEQVPVGPLGPPPEDVMRPKGPPLGEKKWTAAQHHDFQREGNSVGYYTPELEPKVENGKTLVLANTITHNPKINSNPLMDDSIYEISWDGEILWQWIANEHVDEMGFNDEEYKSMQSKKVPQIDWLHTNCASYLGPNKWYDNGDERLHPDNIIFSSRSANILGIIEKKTSKIVWQIGPRYDETPELEKLGWIIGPHHAHMIPIGLPGAGNILVYDNGGSAGYGRPDPVNRFSYNRDYSRVLEFNPVTLEIIWEYSPRTLGYFFMDSMREYSPYVSSAQRLINNNTLITEGGNGRLIEVTPELQVVWEYISPVSLISHEGPPGLPPQKVPNTQIYRAYRVPYEYVPQLDKPQEEAVIPPDNKCIRFSGSGDNFKAHVV